MDGWCKITTENSESIYRGDAIKEIVLVTDKDSIGSRAVFINGQYLFAGPKDAFDGFLDSMLNGENVVMNSPDGKHKAEVEWV